MSTHKALSSIIHQAKLEALLIFKGFSEGISQAVRGEDTLSALLKLAENALTKKNKTKVLSYKTGNSNMQMAFVPQIGSS